MQETARATAACGFDQEVLLGSVRELIADTLAHTPAGGVAGPHIGMLTGGKMLRGRLVIWLGSVRGIGEDYLITAAAAVEMLHAGSLLHDDLIDGSQLRRGRPALWVQEGTAAAVLLGDMLFFLALEKVRQLGDRVLLDDLMTLAGEACSAEAEQELVLRGGRTGWDEYVSLVSRKTGSLFAFAAVACGGGDAALRSALRSAGYRLGTAYQLADDYWDARGVVQGADKLPGGDARRSLPSIAAFAMPEGAAPSGYIEKVAAEAGASLKPWPEVRAAWDGYMQAVMWPALRRLMGESLD